jgi:hypothetical protein
MASRLSKTTQDHDEIRRWAEARNAIPCEVASTERDGEAGILRFCFPNAKNRNDDSLKQIEWDRFFEKFDENGLSMVFQEKTAGGARSNFNKLVHANSEAGSRSGSGSRSTASRSGSSGDASSTRSSGSKSSTSSSGSRSKSTSKSGSGHGRSTHRRQAA